jgi:hypothetical protein
VILAEKNVSRLTALDHVVKVESKHGREARRNSSGRSIRVRDRNTNLLAARLISLGFVARENDELRNQRSAPGYPPSFGSSVNAIPPDQPATML